jgi:hypothetical protein
MRRCFRIVPAILASFFVAALCPGTGPATKTAPQAGGQSSSAGNALPSFVLRPAPFVQMPGVKEYKYLHAVDCNSPLHWDGDTVYLFNSFLHPYRTSGPDVFHQADQTPVHLGDYDDLLYMWIEATFKDDDGTLYGGFHHEPDGVCFSDTHLPTAPKIGWLRSEDNGKNWKDLGFIIMASPCAVNCKSDSPWDAGGTGDFVFLPDAKKEFFYFYGTSYDPRFEEQGVWAARMAYADRNNPSEKVLKWYKGGWSEPALWGHVTPVFPASRDYHKQDGSMFWGPSIHWNTHLKMYVMVLNHAINTRLDADGIYISFNRDIGNPEGWSKPTMLINLADIRKATAGGESMLADVMNNGWYPQVIGTGKGETDKLAGRTARLFLGGLSRLEITFLEPGENADR